MKKSLKVSGRLPGNGDSVVETRRTSSPWLIRAALERFTPIWRQPLQKIQNQPWLAAGISAIERTWGKLIGSFCELIDPYLSRLFPEMRLVALLDSSGCMELHKVMKGAATPLWMLGTLDPKQLDEISTGKWTAIELRLRPDQLLQRTLSLPAASRDFLGPIIEHKLERLTPWRSENVLYCYRVSTNSENSDSISVTLTAISKEQLAAPLQALADAGLVPTAIGPQQQLLTEPLQVNLLDQKSISAHLGSRRLVSRIVSALLVGLTALNLISSGWASSAAGQQQEASISLTKARRLLQTASLSSLGSREKALLKKKNPGSAMVVLIDRLATAIPSDTYLKQLSVTSAKLRLVGSSGNAPALIADLEAIGLINVRFASAVTREKDQTDSFEMTADRAASPPAGLP